MVEDSPRGMPHYLMIQQEKHPVVSDVPLGDNIGSALISLARKMMLGIKGFAYANPGMRLQSMNKKAKCFYFQNNFNSDLCFPLSNKKY